ncbi:ComEC/Rec2 family competence protein [Sphingobacterium sp. Mn56C]|uniref:ComEC/Rec2 family competence protein n=1 Tax=Sphingobacterium sp. Mn56C TaxID=3395261 RepID=UPI003BE25339
MAYLEDKLLDVTLSKVPMMRLLLPFTLGILVAQYFYIPFFDCIVLILILLFVLLCVFIKQPIVTGVFTVFFSLFTFFSGLWITAKSIPTYQDNHFSKLADSTLLMGVIDEEPVFKNKSYRFFVNVTWSAATAAAEGGSTSGRLLAYVQQQDDVHQRQFEYGDKVLFLKRCIPVEGPKNPREFNYKQYLAYVGVYDQCFIQQSAIQILAKNQRYVLRYYAINMRHKLLEKYKRYLKIPEAYQAIAALILGYRGALDQHVKDAFSQTGTIHILSVSGLHVSMVFACMAYLLQVLDRYSWGRVVRIVFICMMVWIYVFLTGLAAPILRAGIMLSFYLVSMLFYRQQQPLNTLFASAFFILLCAPNALFQVGFQLSYLAMLGIMLVFPLFKAFYMPKNKYLAALFGTCYVGMAAQLFTAPVVIYYFGQFPTYFLIANLGIGYCVAAVMYLGLLLACCPIVSLSIVLGQILDFMLLGIFNVLRRIANFPFATIDGIVWTATELLLYYLALALLLLGLCYQKKLYLKLGALSVALLITLCVASSIQQQQYRGIRIYTLKQGFAVASIASGKVVVVSSLDSLRHPALRYSLFPDVKRYARMEDIKFIFYAGNTGATVDLLGQKLFVMDRLSPPALHSYRYLLWRHNNSSPIEPIIVKNPALTILVDGSNTASHIDRLKKVALKYPHRFYFLNNNFAYVWPED